MKSVVTRIKLPKLESATTHSQPQDEISLMLYPASRALVRRRMECAVTRIQLPELELVAG